MGASFIDHGTFLYQLMAVLIDDIGLVAVGKDAILSCVLLLAATQVNGVVSLDIAEVLGHVTQTR